MNAFFTSNSILNFSSIDKTFQVDYLEMQELALGETLFVNWPTEEKVTLVATDGTILAQPIVYFLGVC